MPIGELSDLVDLYLAAEGNIAIREKRTYSSIPVELR